MKLLKNPVARFEEINRIYEEAFPEIERRTKEKQRDLLSHPLYQLLAIEVEGEIQAFLGYWKLPDCIFFEHLATAKKSRGKGYGKELLKSGLNAVDQPVFLEIEPVTPKDPITEKRAGFYKNMGFIVNRFPYLQMPLKHGDRPIPLWILSYKQPINEETFMPFKKQIYEIVYGIKDQGIKY